MRLLSVSRQTLYRWGRQGFFDKPIQLSPGKKGLSAT